jgi:phosphoribosyl 1,2-cyclic phosphodiesterase
MPIETIRPRRIGPGNLLPKRNKGNLLPRFNTEDFGALMQLVFWGTRGSLPMNTPKHRLFGGNTACIGVHAGDDMVVFDGGSGLIHLGSEMVERDRKEIDICFSHFHSDHICGLPFFKPFFDSSFTVRLHSFGTNDATLYDAINGYLSSPIFPIGLANFKAQIEFVEHGADDALSIGDLRVSACPIPHPGGAHALKAVSATNTQGGARGNESKSFVYATDTEHNPTAINTSLVAFMREVDMAVYDCTYDDAEFATKQGWGHSTWQEGLRLAMAAEVKQFGIFHHEPERSDEMLLAIEAQAQEMMPHSFVTRDYMHIGL